jgi:hemerythrin-like metal-binding protein
MFEWKSEYSVNIGSIDAQHQTLFGRCRDLHEALRMGQGRSVLRRLLDRLAQYGASHFAHEERLLQSHKYPGLAKHRAEHAEMTKRLAEFQEEFDAGRANIAMDGLQYLQDELDRHIKGSDALYAPWLRAQMVAQVQPAAQSMRSGA